MSSHSSKPRSRENEDKKNNPFIHTGYRAVDSYKKLLLSIFVIHNETFNIWTHLCGLILFFVLLIYTVKNIASLIHIPNILSLVNEIDKLLHGNLDKTSITIDHLQIFKAHIYSIQDEGLVKLVERSLGNVKDMLGLSLHNLSESKILLSQLKERLSSIDILPANGLTTLPIWPLVVFMISAIACFLFSTLYHTFESAPHSHIFHCCDYAGIVLLISGSIIPPIVYGFRCNDFLATIYGTSNLAFAVLVLVLNFMKFMAERRLTRVLLFVMHGVSAVIPLLHHILMHGIFEHLWFFVLMGLFYLLGAFIYSYHLPERYFPGLFDIYLNSHQIWHVAVVAAALSHYFGILKMMTWSASHVCES